MSGGGHAAEDMRRMEEDKQQRITAATEAINAQFSPSAQRGAYDQQQQAVAALNAQDVARQYAQASRVNNYGLARAGLLGGQADIDSEAELNRLNQAGIAKAQMLGENAANDLRATDKRAQQQLIAAAQSGLDVGQAAQMSQAALQDSANNAASARHAATIGNLFNDLAWAYLAGQQQAGQWGGPDRRPLWDNTSPRSRYGGRG